MPIFDPDKCPTKLLVACIGLSPDRVGRLHVEGVLEQTAPAANTI